MNGDESLRETLGGSQTKNENGSFVPSGSMRWTPEPESETDELKDES